MLCEVISNLANNGLPLEGRGESTYGYVLCHVNIRFTAMDQDSIALLLNVVANAQRCHSFTVVLTRIPYLINQILGVFAGSNARRKNLLNNYGNALSNPLFSIR
jgi:hypothetical protein